MVQVLVIEVVVGPALSPHAGAGLGVANLCDLCPKVGGTHFAEETRSDFTVAVGDDDQRNTVDPVSLMDRFSLAELDDVDSNVIGFEHGDLVPHDHAAVAVVRTEHHDQPRLVPAREVSAI